jgi:uncharacterized protein (TIGR02145 family)
MYGRKCRINRNLCPTGWHVPTDAEWTTLTTSLGGEDVASGKLKEAGTSHWIPSNEGATNATGFTALPGGHRYYDGTFISIGFGGYWWSSTEYPATDAYQRHMDYYSSCGGSVCRLYSNKLFGFSVRCLKDN